MQKKIAEAIFGLLVLAVAFTLGFILGTNSQREVQITVHKEERVVQNVVVEGQTEGEVSYPIDLNMASQYELESLPGVGPSLAKKIMEYRAAYGPFLDKIQIMDVPGIGEGKYAAMEQLITVKEAEQNENSGSG